MRPQHPGVTLQVSAKINTLSDAGINIYHCPDRAPHVHTHLAVCDPCHGVEVSREKI